MANEALGLDLAAAAEAKRRLIEGGLVWDDWKPVAWSNRQFESDSSTPRVRQFREKQKGNVSETLPKRRSNAIDQNRTEQIQTDKKAPRGARITAEFTIPDEQLMEMETRWGYPGMNIRGELESFRDYWLSVAGPKAVKVDWVAAFRERLRWLSDHRTAAATPANTMTIGGKPLTWS